MPLLPYPRRLQAIEVTPEPAQDLGVYARNPIPNSWVTPAA